MDITVVLKSKNHAIEDVKTVVTENLTYRMKDGEVLSVEIGNIESFVATERD